MIEPWLSEQASKIIPVLTVLPIFILGVTSGFTESKTFQRYMLVISLTGSIGAIIFGLLAKFLGQPSFVYFGFILAGAIVTVMSITALYVMQQVD